MQVVFVLLCIH